MNTETTIHGTDEAWESGQLGADEEFVGHLTAEEIAADAVLINVAADLQQARATAPKSKPDPKKAAKAA